MELSEQAINDWYDAEKERVAKEYAKKTEKGLDKEHAEKFLKSMKKVHKQYDAYFQKMKNKKERQIKIKNTIYVLDAPVRIPLVFLIRFIRWIFNGGFGTIKDTLQKTKEKKNEISFKMKLFSLKKRPVFDFFIETSIKAPWKIVRIFLGHIFHYIDKKTLPTRKVIAKIYNFFYGILDKIFISPILAPSFKYTIMGIKYLYGLVMGDKDDKK